MKPEWTVRKISEIAQINANTYSPKEKWPRVAYLDTGNITENIIDSIQHIDTKTGKLPSRARRKVIRNSIVYSTVRPNQKHFGIMRQVPENFLVSTGFAVIDADPAQADADYLYYYLTQQNIVDYLHTIAEQSVSAYPSIKAGNIGDLEISLPPVRIQSRIASILRALDDKIAINAGINDNLEQQAQSIFRMWFIHSACRHAWETGTFSDLIESTLGGDWGKERQTGKYTKDVYCIRGADILTIDSSSKGKMPTRYIIPKSYDSKQLMPGDIVVEISGGSPTQSTGRTAVITQSLLERYDKGMICTNFCRALKPKTGYSMFVSYYWKYLYNQNIFFSYENGTTGIKNLNLSAFLSTERILLPPEDLVYRYETLCQTFHNQINTNGLESDCLSLLRDSLLPRLMSGELDVSGVEL